MVTAPSGQKRRRTAGFITVCLVLGSLRAFAQTTPPSLELTPPPYFLMLKRDATAIAVAPLQWDSSTWKKFGIGIGAVGLLMLADDKIREEVSRSSNDTTRNIADVVEPFGSEGSWAVLAAFYGAGRLMDNPRARAVAEDGLMSSLIAAGILTPALKSLVGRSRPSQSPRNYEFLYRGASFPSGHTTQAFALAAVIAEHYDSVWIDGVAYGVAGLVGYARMEHNAHFASDVVAGALIGVAVGKAVVRLNGEQRSIRLEPMVTRDGVGLSVRLKLSQRR
jgi:membrane-associated phospholipid phosphatase